MNSQIEAALNQYRRDLSCPGMPTEDATAKAARAVREACTAEFSQHLVLLLKVNSDEELREGLTALIATIGPK